MPSVVPSVSAWRAYARRSYPHLEDGPCPPTVVTVFAGAGGDALGFQSAGFRGLAMVEWRPPTKREPNPRQYGAETLRAAVAAGFLTGAVVNENANTVDFRRWKGATLLSGGPPCQPFTSSGKQLGPEDLRDGFPAFLRAIREIGPRYVWAENVNGLLFEKFAGYRQLITRQLDALGYGWRWDTMRFAEHGIPQTRERVILVAWRQGLPAWPKPAPSSQRVTLGEALERVGLRWADTSTGFRDPVPSATADGWLDKHPPSRMDRPAYTQVSRHGSGNVNLVELPFVEPGAWVFLHDTMENQIRRLAGIEPRAPIPEAVEDAYWEETNTRGSDYVPALVMGRVDHAPRDEWQRDGVWIELTENHRYPAGARVFVPVYQLRPMQAALRRMSPRYMAVAQGFPLAYPFQGTPNMQGAQIGNAVPPPGAEAYALTCPALRWCRA